MSKDKVYRYDFTEIQDSTIRSILKALQKTGDLTPLAFNTLFEYIRGLQK